MTDEKKEDTSSNPFFVRGGIPFVFLPSAFATGFNLSSSDHQHTPSPSAATADEPPEEKKEIQTEETVDEDEADHNNEKNDLRISQPKYSQLLKELDFSHTRMVDVTNLLSNELEQQNEYFSPEENESPPKNSKKSSSSSSTTTNEDYEDDFNDQTSNNHNNSETDTSKKIKDEKDLADAEREIQNDLNNLSAIIEAAAQLSPHEISEEVPDESRKKPTLDEDDDTSKQATQNYDLHDNEQEDIVPSSKSSKIPRLIKQNSNGTRNESKSIVSSVDLNKEKANQTINQTNKHEEEEEEEGDQVESISWEKLVPKDEQTIPAEERKDPSNKPPEPSVFKTAYSISSSSSDTDSIVQRNQAQEKQVTQPEVPPLNIPSQANRQDSQETLIDENLDDFSSQLKQVLIDQERQTTGNSNSKEERTSDGLASMVFPLPTANVSTGDERQRSREDLLRHSSNQRQQIPMENFERSSNSTRKKTHHHHRQAASRNTRKHDDDWLTMLEKLEREHRTRLEKQQQEYETYMHTLEEKMKQRFDDYLTLTNGFQESRLDDYDDPHHHPSKLNPRTHTSIPIDSNIGRYKTHTHTHQYRPLAEDLISHYYPADSTLNILSTERKAKAHSTSIPRSDLKEEVSNFRTDPSGTHARHLADLKVHYEYEINDLKSQVNRLRMGHTSSSTRQSMDTIERINNDNIRLHDEISDLRHSVKMTEDENKLLKRQVEELREQLSNKDVELRNYHRTIADLEQQITEAENTKERQGEKSRHADRQTSFYRDENENLKTDLNFARERLLRLEERSREQEMENEQLRRQLYLQEGDSARSSKSRLTDDHKLSTAMNFNTPTSRDYGRFTLSTTKPPSPRETTLPFSRYQPTSTENYFRHEQSPRPMTRITDYLNDQPTFPQPYVSPIRNVFSPRKTSPNRRRVEPLSTRNPPDRQNKQVEQLEQKFDQLLKKKRDLETRLSRIPLRGLSTTDRQLSDVLEREIERVEQQMSSVKLELRKLNVFRS